MSELIRRLRYLLNRRRLDRELASEMEFHREMATRHGGIAFGNTLACGKRPAMPGAGPGSIVCRKTFAMRLAS
jgi:hypothetical protein